MFFILCIFFYMIVPSQRSTTEDRDMSSKNGVVLSFLLSLGQDVLAEVSTIVANNVAGRLVVADVDGPVGAGAELLGAANGLGALPDD